MNRALCLGPLLSAAFLLILLTFICLSPASADGGTWPPIAQWGVGVGRDAARQGDYLYIAASAAMTIMDVSLPSQPRLVGYYDPPCSYVCTTIAVSGAYAYLGSSMSMYVIDVTDPTDPLQVGHCVVPEPIQGLAVAGHHVYVADGRSGLRIVDVSNPAAPTPVGFYLAAGEASEVAVSGSYAYVVDASRGLRVVDVSQPQKPVQVGYWESTKRLFPSGVAILGGYAYIADRYYAHVLIVDVSDPASPWLAGSVALLWCPQDIEIEGRYAYVATREEPPRDAPQWLYVLDLADAACPGIVGACQTSEAAGSGGALAASWPYVYVAGNEKVIAVDVLDASTPLVVGQWGFETGRVAAQGGYAYAATHHNRLVVIDASDPQQPSRLGSCIANGQSIEVSGDYVYLTARAYYDTGLTVVDVSTPGEPVVVGRYVDPEWNMWLGLAVAGRYVYVARANSLWIMDVSDPSCPKLAGALAGLNWAEDVAVHGDNAYVARGRQGLSVVDVSDPTRPAEIGHWQTHGLAYGVAVSDSHAYVGDSNSMYVLDIADPFNPVPVGSLALSEPVWPDSNLVSDIAVSGAYAYVVTAGAGLRIVDVSDPTDPKEVAFWDTPGWALDVAVSDGRVYVADAYWGTIVFPEYATGVIAGQVRVRGTTANIASATVSAYLDGKLWRTTLTDARGLYVIENLTAGTYVVTASKPGYIRQTKADITVTPNHTTYINFGLEMSGRITGQVRERGTEVNLPNATVAAYLDGRLKAVTTTDSRGIYVMDTDLPGGSYLLSAAKAGYRTQAKAGIAVVSGETAYVNFGLERVVRLKGQVRDRGTGRPLIGAALHVYVYPGDTTVASTTTEAPHGIYEFGEELAPATYNVTASMPGYMRQTKWNVDVSGDETAYCNFNLEPSGRLMGQVQDRDSGLPLIGAAVAMYAYPGNVQVAATTTKEPYGIYEVNQDLPAGTYRVTAVTSGYAAQNKAPITIVAGETTYVNFGLQRIVRLKGQVRDRSTNLPLIGAALRVYVYGDNTVVASTTTEPPYGIYEFGAELPPGTYKVSASTAGYVTQPKWNIRVSEDASTYVNFNLLPSCALEGQVRDSAAGAPIVGAAVEIYRDGVLLATATTTAPWGVYSIDTGLPEGLCFVWASKSGYITRGRAVTLTLDATSYANFALQPVSAVSRTLRGS